MKITIIGFSISKIKEEVNRITTPKSCTIKGLNDMEHKGFSSSLIQGMVASFNKINNIKKEQI